MRNPHIDLALVLLTRRRREQETDASRIQRQIIRDGNGLRLMDDDRTLGEHLADAERELNRSVAAITYLESLK
jgi:hypothetical protein